jgi:hypothetical protein
MGDAILDYWCCFLLRRKNISIRLLEGTGCVVECGAGAILSSWKFLPVS